MEIPYDHGLRYDDANCDRVLSGGPEALVSFNLAQKVLGFLDYVLVVSFAGSFVVPLGIWFLVSFRRSDWAKLFGNSRVRLAQEPLR